MASTNERKVILFLTEGETDKTSLVGPFASFIGSGAMVDGEPFRCDVTTVNLFRGDATFKVYDDALETVRQFVLQYLGSGQRVRGYNWKDLDRIIHIVDTDGAFIADTNILEDKRLTEIEYGPMNIRTPSPEAVAMRNSTKRQALDRLSRAGKLTWKGVSVPYRVYYMSRNLEHALHGVQEKLSDDQKEMLSQAYRRKYENDPEGFYEHLRQIANGTPLDYKQSWSYIREDVHSLMRSSNIVIAADSIAKADRLSLRDTYDSVAALAARYHAQSASHQMPLIEPQQLPSG